MRARFHRTPLASNRPAYVTTELCSEVCAARRTDDDESRRQLCTATSLNHSIARAPSERAAVTLRETHVGFCESVVAPASAISSGFRGASARIALTVGANSA